MSLKARSSHVATFRHRHKGKSQPCAEKMTRLLTPHKTVINGHFELSLQTDITEVSPVINSRKERFYYGIRSPSRLVIEARSVDDMPFPYMACMGYTDGCFVSGYGRPKVNHLSLSDPRARYHAHSVLSEYVSKPRWIRQHAHIFMMILGWRDGDNSYFKQCTFANMVICKNGVPQSTYIHEGYRIGRIEI
ncbi:hypothetical protein Tco_1367380 [Tanacetum coccineum]